MALTLYDTNTELPTGLHTGNIEKLASANPPPAPLNVTLTGIGTSGKVIAVFTSAAGVPNQTTWPAGGALYEATVDVVSMDSTLTYGFRTQGAALGHLARVDSGLLAHIESRQQTEAAFTTPGLKTASFTAASWPTGLAADRIEKSLAAVKVFGHGNDSMTVRFDGDGQIRGPWTGGGTPIVGRLDGDVEIVSASAQGQLSGNVEITPATLAGTVEIV